MYKEGPTLQLQVVNGGFILNTYTTEDQGTIEVFTSQAKLLKAIRAIIDQDTKEDTKKDNSEPATPMSKQSYGSAE